MSVRGGENLEWLKPLAANRENEVGSHVGKSRALNVRNPQPGYHYYNEHRVPGSIQKRLNEGWRPISSHDPESWGVDLSEVDGVKFPELDGLQAFGDVICMKIPIEKYRALKEERARQAKVLREGTTEEYLTKGQTLAAQVGSEDDLYYAARHHSIQED